MRLRIKVLLVAASAMLSSAGCEEPKDVIPVAPPGFELTRVPTTPQGDGAQALGEAANIKAPTKQNVVPKIVSDAPPTPIGQPKTTSSGLIYETLQEGTGPACKSGDQVEMHYTGTLTDGTEFDSSKGRKPLSVNLGSGGVIAGWDLGIPGMKVGEKRKLTIPPGLAYGSRPQNKIPGDSTLIFEVELVAIK